MGEVPGEVYLTQWILADRQHFIHLATKLAEGIRHAVFVDRVVADFEIRDEILQLLREHITDNIVKVAQLSNRPGKTKISTMLFSDW